ncbi:MAG: hypothetical protein HYT27_02875 [Parcubacteria group bacterium]|nr:hypothetical protein [Parcubacteria group bacterium]
MSRYKARRGNGKKKKGQIRHAQKRARERHGLHLDENDLVTLANRIRKQNLPQHKEKAVFVKRKTNRISMWFVWHKNQWLPVAYDKERKSIATILPEGALGKPPEPFKSEKETNVVAHADQVHFELPPKKYDAFVDTLEKAERIPPNKELKRLMRQKAPWEKK